MTREIYDSQNQAAKMSTDKGMINANYKFCRYYKKLGYEIKTYEKRKYNNVHNNRSETKPLNTIGRLSRETKPTSHPVKTIEGRNSEASELPVKLSPETLSFAPTVNILAKQLRNEVILLLDTDADPNLIKACNMKPNTAILREDTLYLNDIGIGYTKTLGSLKILFMSLQIKLHIVSGNFQIREEGILRNDFLGRYSVIINYKTGQVEYNGSKIQIKIRNSIIISARPISTFYVKIFNPEIKTDLISRLHLDEGMYGGNVIATNRNRIAYIKITNTREIDETVILPFVKLEEFKILGISKKKLKSHNSKKVSFSTINAMITKEIHNNRGKIIRNLLRLDHLNTEETNHVY